MARTHATAESGHWTAGTHPLQVEYAIGVLDGIRVEAVAGFLRFPRGGIEIGGVLFGSIEGNTVRVTAARAVACEYAFGPSYVLSEKDEETLRNVLEGTRTDQELIGRVAVGWYHSHTRSEIFLSTQDLDLYDRYFPGKRQIALVVKPEQFGSARAGFFLRELDGSIEWEQSYQEFTLAAPEKGAVTPPPVEPAVTTPVREPVAPEPESAIADADAEPPPLEGDPVPSAEVAAEEAQPVRSVAVRRRTRFRVPRWVWMPLAGCLALGLGYMVPPLALEHTTGGVVPLSLRVADANGMLQIAWDRKIAGRPNVRGGSLEIVDGGEHLIVPFDMARLKEGNIGYARRSDDVEVRLRVDGGTRGAQEESVRFLGGPVAQRTEAAKTPAVSGLLQPLTQRTSAIPDQARTAPLKLRTFDLAQLPSAVKPAQEIALPVPPEVAGGTPSLQANGPVFGSGALRSVPPPPAPAPVAPAVEKRKPAYSGPTAGRILWTGSLFRGSVVTVDGGRISAGAAVGELPGVPVRIAVHPADLGGRGLTVYTAGGSSRREAPGPGNGWNPTAYDPDPRRASELLVLESPGPQNGWKKLVLRNEGRDLTVVVVDWRVVSD